jgi:hypothetical protein
MSCRKTAKSDGILEAVQRAGRGTKWLVRADALTRDCSQQSTDARSGGSDESRTEGEAVSSTAMPLKTAASGRVPAWKRRLNQHRQN